MSPEKEAQQVAEAFELYFELGINRTTDAVAEQLNLAPATVEGWAEVHNWDQHIQERLMLLRTQFSEEYGTRTMEISSELMGMVSDTLDNFREATKGIPFDITSVEDFSKLSLAYERMCRAHVLLVDSIQGSEDDGRRKNWAELLKDVEEG